VACVQLRTSRAAPGGILVVGATYAVPLLTHQGGPWSAGVVGAGLLALAWVTQADVRRQRRLPTEPLHWSWRTAVGVAACAVVLDVAVALVGGRPHSHHLSTLAVLVAAVTSTGLLALCAVLAEGARLPTRVRASTGSAAATGEPHEHATQ
jgi:hypothetical protein